VQVCLAAARFGGGFAHTRDTRVKKVLEGEPPWEIERRAAREIILQFEESLRSRGTARQAMSADGWPPENLVGLAPLATRHHVTFTIARPR